MNQVGIRRAGTKPSWDRKNINYVMYASGTTMILRSTDLFCTVAGGKILWCMLGALLHA